MSNLLLLVVVSRSGSASDVGAVAIAVVVYQLMTGGFRTLFGEVALVSARALTDDLVSSLFRALAWSGLWAAGAVAAVGLVLGTSVAGPLLVLAVFLVPLLVQDALRFVSFARFSPRVAALGDGLWVVALATAAIAVELSNAHPSPTQWFALWCAGGVLAVLVMDPIRVLSRGGNRSRWKSTAAPVSRYFLPEFLVGVCVTWMPPLVIAAVASLETAGELRFATGFFGPITITWAAAVNVFIPRRVGQQWASLRGEAVLSGAFAVATLGWLALGWALPTDLGESLLGAAWAGAKDWLPWLGLGYTALASSGGAIAGLRVRGAANRSLKARLIAAPLALVGTGLGYVAWGSAGYGAAFFLACVVISVLAWVFLIELNRSAS
jgi:hypothetical protein